ncbi:phosphoribosylglycinamide formyltransferase [Tianweitania sp. BSSL-BM11]|uniref:Phosphoribosylglycinamide formyltransferase n=1 Tax=Tianweitania aestuarii TaxID=2814886 RepID=A0ABS5RSQ5_9HYPH|nr:phosphoribosylglycinamide formyltransferase [Tianweitania aestuarii]MBS9720019.1 phosphoribosylglycinamide formyltransferase [Tianweitania aestuarii]
MNGPRKRVVVLISGRGSNMKALIEAARNPAYPAQIVGVISNRSNAAGLDFAARAGIPTRVITKSDHPDSASQDAALERALTEFGAELICLAGYMRLLTQSFVSHWSGRMINIHPSLLPLFKGLHPHQQALDAGVRLHGCSVHFVTFEMDSGPIIAQAAVPVLSGDTEDSLSARTLAAEHKLYPLALQLLAEGKVRMDGDKAVFRTAESNTAAMLISPDLVEQGPDLEALARSTP